MLRLILDHSLKSNGYALYHCQLEKSVGFILDYSEAKLSSIWIAMHQHAFLALLLDDWMADLISSFCLFLSSLYLHDER